MVDKIMTIFVLITVCLTMILSFTVKHFISFFVSQAWSGGQFKHVIGRPIFKGKVVDHEECISMAFLYSPPKMGNSFKTNKAKTISLAQQAIVAMLLTLVYHFVVYVYNL